jgi:N-acetylmuramoyl-L-alanine amidase
MMWAVVAAAVLVGTGPVPASDAATLLVVSSRGETFVPVSRDRGHAALAAPVLARALPLMIGINGTVRVATLTLAGQPFQFPLDAPAFRFGGRLYPMARGAYLARDTLFVPLQWLAEHVPRLFSERYRYDPIAARFDDLGVAPAGVRAGATDANAGVRPSDAPAAARALGLRWRHVVTIDAGHGGRDPGNPGKYFPRGVQEKHVALALARRLRTALDARGVGVLMTRTSDTYVEYAARSARCSEACDLFVSIHVNSMPSGRRQTIPDGVETYFLAEAKSEEARRVQAMENEAIRFETGGALPDGSDPLGFILRDMQQNEHLRESGELASLVQSALGPIHPGGDRGVSQADLYVLRNARRPAILLEAGFATNRNDAAFLISARGQRALAEALADAIVAYLVRYERKLVVDEGS